MNIGGVNVWKICHRLRLKIGFDAYTGTSVSNGGFADGEEMMEGGGGILIVVGGFCDAGWLGWRRGECFDV